MFWLAPTDWGIIKDPMYLYCLFSVKRLHINLTYKQMSDYDGISFMDF